MALHLLKYAVGIESVAHMAKVQKDRRARRLANGEGKGTWHFTRNFPRRSTEVLDGGCFYWIIHGEITACQKIMGLERRERENGRKQCAIRLSSKIIRTQPVVHRPIQGWRYLAPGDAPPNLNAPSKMVKESGTSLPPALRAELRALGLL